MSIFPDSGETGAQIDRLFSKFRTASRLVALRVGKGHDMPSLASRIAGLMPGCVVRLWPHDAMPETATPVVVVVVPESGREIDAAIGPMNASVVAARVILYSDSTEVSVKNESLRWTLEPWTITVPPWRQMYPDVEASARIILADMGYVAELSAQFVHAIRNYSWPGGEIELRGRLGRAIALAGASALDPRDLGLPEIETPRILTEPPPFVALSDAKHAFELLYTLAAIVRESGNRTRAAKTLGVDPRTVFRAIERLRTGGVESSLSSWPQICEAVTQATRSQIDHMLDGE